MGVAVIERATLYTLYAVSFFVIAMLTTDIPAAHNIYHQVTDYFETTPVSKPGQPLRTFEDLSTPEEVYDWLFDVATPGMFEEAAQLGSAQYCSTTTRCGLGEGDVDHLDQCVSELQPGAHNCPLYMLPGSSCCETCMEAGIQFNPELHAATASSDEPFCTSENSYLPKCQTSCPDTRAVRLAGGKGVAWFNATVDDMSERCNVQGIGNSVFIGNGPWTEWVTLEEPPQFQDYVDWCPENVEMTSGDRQVLIGHYNSIVGVRLSMKKRNMVDNPEARFKNAYPEILQDTPNNRAGVFRADVDHGDSENKTDIVYGHQKWEYENQGGYAMAGAFTELIDPRDGLAAVRTQVAGLKDAGWFGHDLSSLVYELIVYNGNLNMFVRISFIVEMGSVGSAVERVEGSTFDLSLFEFRYGKNIARIIIEGIFLCLFVVFVIWEVEDFTDDTMGYLTRLLSLLDVGTLTLNLVVLILEISMVLSHSYWSFNFPLPPPHSDEMKEQFNLLENISYRASTLQICMAISSCLMFMRAVSLIAEVSPSWGVLINSVTRGKHFFAYFFILFFLMLVAFAFCANILFGATSTDFMTFGSSFLTCFAMVLNGVYYDELIGADPVFGYIFFFVFHILFSFVLVNILVSVLIFGYSAEMDFVKNLSQEQDPLLRMLANLKKRILSRFTSLRSLFTFQYLMAAGQPQGRVSAERLAVIDKKRQAGLRIFSMECFGMTAMFIIFFFMINSIARTAIANKYLDTQRSMMNVSWTPESDRNNKYFEDIRTMDDVRLWADKAIVGNLYGCVVECSDWDTTSDPKCLTQSDCLESGAVRQGYSLQRGPPESGYIGWFPDDKVNGVNRQTFNRLNQWTYGLTDNNFARMTFQLSCYVENESRRWAPGFPRVLYEDKVCTSEPCQRDYIENNVQCVDFDGNPLSIHGFTGSSSGFRYEFDGSGTNTFQGLGGMPVGLGQTQEEATQVLTLVGQDEIFHDVSSVVFDWVVYNGNADLFAYTSAEFSLTASGKLSKILHTQHFPMNIFYGMGPDQHYNARLADTVLMISYLTLLLWFISVFLKYVNLQMQESAERQRPAYGWFIDLFNRDLWNYVDIISVILNILCIVYFLMFALESSVTRECGGGKTFTMGYKLCDFFYGEDEQPINKFQYISRVYWNFLWFGSLNAFFATIRVVKYVSTIPQLRIVVATCRSAFSQLFGFLVTMVLMLFGFVVLFHFRYGMVLPEFNTPMNSFLTLFRFMAGSFDVRPLFKASPLFSIVVFTILQIIFFMIIGKSFIAILVSRWRESTAQFRAVTSRKSVFSNAGGMFKRCFGKKHRRSEDEIEVDMAFWRQRAALKYVHLMTDEGKIYLRQPEADDDNDGDEGKARDRTPAEEDIIAFAMDLHQEHQAKLGKEETPDTDVPELHDDGIPEAPLANPAEVRAKLHRAAMTDCDKHSGHTFFLGNKKMVGDQFDFFPKSQEGRGSQDLGEDVFGRPEPLVRVSDEVGAVRYNIGFMPERIDKRDVAFMNHRIESHPVELAEIWLDALTTAIEAGLGCDTLREACKNPAQVIPRSSAEKKELDDKKAGLESRLDTVFKWIQTKRDLGYAQDFEANLSVKEEIMREQS